MSKTNKYSEQFKAIAYCPAPPCDCDICYNPESWDEPDDGPYIYKCAACKRDIPYCLGADSRLADGRSTFEFCNDCVLVIQEGEEPELNNDTPRKLG